MFGELIYRRFSAVVQGSHDRVALRVPGDAYTFGELERRRLRVAAALIKQARTIALTRTFY